MLALFAQICKMISAKPAELLLTPLSQGQHSHAQTRDIIHFLLPWHSSTDMIVLTQPGQRKRKWESERQNERERGHLRPKGMTLGCSGPHQPFKCQHSTEGRETGEERRSVWGQERILASDFLLQEGVRSWHNAAKLWDGRGVLSSDIFGLNASHTQVWIFSLGWRETFWDLWFSE